MPATELEITPEERFREIATILAAGILRLRTRPSAHVITPEESAESSGISLDACHPRSPYIHAG